MMCHNLGEIRSIRTSEGHNGTIYSVFDEVEETGTFYLLHTSKDGDGHTTAVAKACVTSIRYERKA